MAKMKKDTKIALGIAAAGALALVGYLALKNSASGGTGPTLTVTFQ